MVMTRFDFERPLVDIEDELRKSQDAYQKLVTRKKVAEEKLRAEQEAKRAAEAAKAAGKADYPREIEATLDKMEAEAETAAQDEMSEYGVVDPSASTLELLSQPEDQVDPKLAKKIADLQDRLDHSRAEVYAKLTPWQRVQIARHPMRPHSLDYIRRIITDWTELHGDRSYADDQAVITGLGKLNDRSVAVIAQQKGSDLRDNLQRNFGMMHPEGYRKAMRVMKLAEKFSLPILVFIDTPGAYPGIGAEERGQGEAIGRNIMEMFMIRTPIICTVIGEGASGGALGVGIGDRLLMLEYAWYCVISPEGCASILWRDPAKAPDAAQALKLTADDLARFGVIDEIVPEPLGGAHFDPAVAGDNLKAALDRQLESIARLGVDELLDQRFDKFRSMGEEFLTTVGPVEAASE